MSFLSRMKSGTGKLACGRGGMAYLVDAAERYGGVTAFGYIHGKYGDGAEVKGVPVDLGAGIALKAAGLALDIFGSGRSKLSPHLNALGDAGISAFLHTVGVGMGSGSGGGHIAAGKGAAKQLGQKTVTAGDVLDAAAAATLAGMARR